MLMPEIRAMKVVSTLLLFVPWIRADDQDRAVAPDDLALLAHGLDRGSDFHPWIYLPYRENQRTAQETAIRQRGKLAGHEIERRAL
jgi:hypothetical protein